MDGERSDGGGGGGGGGEREEMEDEFACAGMLRGSLSSLHSSVERIFRVNFGIGADELPNGNDGQIWLKLRGPRNNVTAAKLFVKGLVNQEQQQEVSYPGVLHCVFCGARGLFMDCLIKNTSAHIVVGSPGFLLISGLTEPVVRAYSLITDLVDRYEGTQGRRTESGDRGSGESLDSRRAFKSLVEKWEDRHILDLLVLPGLVKEILLDLVRESGLNSSPDPGDSAAEGADNSQRIYKTLIEGIAGTRLGGESGDRWDTPSSTTYTLPGHSNNTDRWDDGMAGGLGADMAASDPFLQSPSTSASTRRRAEGAEERRVHSPQEVGEEGQPEELEKLEIEEEEEEEGEEEGELLLSVGSKKEFCLLLKFFTAMGYTEDVVRRVLARTGPKEASKILDLVQQEQDRSDRDQKHQGRKEPNRRDQDQINQDRIGQNRNRPCETEHREGEGGTGGTGKGVNAMSSNGGMGEEARNMMGRVGEGEEGGEGESKRGKEMWEGGNEEDFVLGVLKRAATSCGYTEEKVAEVYGMWPDLSTHQLLLELQRESETGRTDPAREGPREVDDVVLEREARRAGAGEDETGRGNEVREHRVERKSRKEKRETDERGRVDVPNQTAPVAELDFFPWNTKSHPKQLPTNHQTILPEVRGPPLPTYPPTLDLPFTNLSPKQSTHTPYTSNPPHSNVPKQPPQVAPPTYIMPLPAAVRPHPAGSDSSPTRVRQRQGFPTTSSGVVVTGEQRFLEGLQMPFDLQLTDEPEKPGLRMIIIDGSNVAMSHGLGHFFSCRGIALAVQHFWNRGHRSISALLPQWRQKRDPKIKEQRYLTELQTLGLLSYTPSREVQGKRINAYDDRFMLRLAQETDGVIVTNDNLRDLLDESHVWKDIIKKRLLQYTFVGDHFMVPDDPLGRGGPHLDDFLHLKHRPPDPGSHTFAGVASAIPHFKPPRSQTEVLHFRDRTLGRAVEPEAGGSRGKGRGQGRGGHAGTGHQQRQQGAGGPAVRSPEETARLRERLCQVFPGQDSMVTLVLQSHPAETDINSLSDLILEQQRD
uniref:NEDD4-binding protein 1 n=1 Tax=Centroberyx gerrardi TaxID=166262 RepID=UPI003AAC2975